MKPNKKMRMRSNNTIRKKINEYNFKTKTEGVLVNEYSCGISAFGLVQII